MKFVVRIACEEGELLHKVFDQSKSGSLHYGIACMLVDSEYNDDSPVGRDPRVRRKAEALLGCEGRVVTRVEHHRTSTSGVSEAIKEVQEGRSVVLDWCDVDVPYGSDLKDIVDNLLAPARDEP